MIDALTKQHQELIDMKKNKPMTRNKTKKEETLEEMYARLGMSDTFYLCTDGAYRSENKIKNEGYTKAKSVRDVKLTFPNIPW